MLHKVAFKNECSNLLVSIHFNGDETINLKLDANYLHYIPAVNTCVLNT